MKHVYLFQPQYTIVFDGKVTGWIPYSVGVLWNYASQFNDITDSFILKDFIFRRELVDDVINKLENPSICGFSSYIWNINYCLEVAKKIKSKWPSCKIVFGGPQMSEKYLQYTFIDSIILGEGEEAFVSILRNIKNNSPLPRLVQKQRMQDLSYPGPYASGIFDFLLERYPDILWNVTIETNRGCPYSCTFCDWGSLTYSKIKKFDLDNVKKEINWIRNKPVGYVFFADANFGTFKERDLEITRLIKEAADESSVDIINIQNAKNSTEVAFEIEQIIGDKGIGVTLALQSMNPATLSAINRKNLPINNLSELIQLSQKYNVPTYSELILGLPNESFESWSTGLCEILEMGQHNALEVWFTHLLENSELSKPDSREKYGIKSGIYTDYFNFAEHNQYNIDGIDESMELIIATNTMSTQDMVESYMYSWMIIQWHIIGYCQIIAKYVRFINNTTYKEFYDQLFKNIKQDKVFGEKYTYLSTLIFDYLSTGKLKNGVRSGHRFHSILNDWLNDHRTDVINFVKQNAEIFVHVPNWVVELQTVFTYDEKVSYPVHIKGDYDIINQKHEIVTYSVSPKNLSFSDVSIKTRRVGALKNIIQVIKDQQELSK